jgi:ABC-type uncharacterized transport system permease subunit
LLSWFFEFGNYNFGLPFTDAKVWFPWNTNEFESIAAANLQQTLILWVALVLTGLAVAFAFRCGLFNIGAQGQYLAGSIVAVLVATELPNAVDLPGWLLIIATVLAGMLAGAAIAGIAGLLKGTVGAHEVITTIMLNWIVLWVGSYFFGIGGPFQTDEAGTAGTVPSSEDIVEKAKLGLFWGDPLLQGVHIGLFAAVGALVVYSITLNRRPLATSACAVGHNPRRRVAASASHETTSSRWPSRAYSQVSPALSTSSVGSSVWTRLRSRARRSASSASPWHFSAATLPSALHSPPCCSPHSRRGQPLATSILPSSRPISRRVSRSSSRGSSFSSSGPTSSSCWRCDDSGGNEE